MPSMGFAAKNSSILLARPKSVFGILSKLDWVLASPNWTVSLPTEPLADPVPYFM